MIKEAIKVSQLNAYIKVIFELDENLRSIAVSGEICNFKRHCSTGHLYFSLKDKTSSVRVIMFAGNAAKVPHDICDGTDVIVTGSIRCYEVAGQYQIYADNIYQSGKGAEYLEVENLKHKLLKEGLFDESKKKQLPAYPNKIGVITSKTGAVIHDIKTVMNRRYPLCEIVLYPAEVQGKNSYKQIINAIRYFNETPDVDTLIIARGGGSAEDLKPFNCEELARAIYGSVVPVISAVGHESDFTICDLVADKRASTPSVAAEMAVPDIKNQEFLVEECAERLRIGIESKIKFYTNCLDTLQNSIQRNSPEFKIESKLKEIASLEFLLSKVFFFYVSKKEFEYSCISKNLELYSQERILNQGYGLILSKGEVIKNISKLNEQSTVTIKLSDGCASYAITKI